MPIGSKLACQEQETLVLDAAAKCIEATSLLDFTMSAISKEAGLSMGSIYKHIQSKEDVLVALGYQCQIHFRAVAQQVLALPLPIVARIVAVQLVATEHNYPYSFGPQLVTLLANEAVLKRASPGWLDKYIASDIAVEDLFQQQMFEACDTGELIVGPDSRDALAEEIITSVWAVCVGHSQVIAHRNVRERVVKRDLLDGGATIIRALQRLLNTYQWKTELTDDLIFQACEKLEECGLR